jgi:hypothetical protein
MVRLKPLRNQSLQNPLRVLGRPRTDDRHALGPLRKGRVVLTAEKRYACLSRLPQKRRLKRSPFDSLASSRRSRRVAFGGVAAGEHRPDDFDAKRRLADEYDAAPRMLSGADWRPDAANEKHGPCACSRWRQRKVGPVPTLWRRLLLAWVWRKAYHMGAVTGREVARRRLGIPRRRAGPHREGVSKEAQPWRNLAIQDDGRTIRDGRRILGVTGLRRPCRPKGGITSTRRPDWKLTGEARVPRRRDFNLRRGRLIRAKTGCLQNTLRADPNLNSVDCAL